jgi:ATP-dependent RNA circularization protein (DNA/RNA ligase family)
MNEEAQDMRFIEYPKIKTLFKLIPSDAKGKKWDATSGEILPDTAALHHVPINELVLTEKIDGTNMAFRLRDGVATHIQKSNSVCERGAEDKYYFETGDEVVDRILPIVRETDALQNVVLYGELCGPKIQKGGNYFEDRRFLVFDILNTKSMRFFTWGAVEHWCSVLALEHVPVLSHSLQDLSVASVKQYVQSLKSAFNPDYDAEGVVVRHETDTTWEKRWVAKIRRKDFA